MKHLHIIYIYSAFIPFFSMWRTIVLMKLPMYMQSNPYRVDLSISFLFIFFIPASLFQLTSFWLCVAIIKENWCSFTVINCFFAILICEKNVCRNNFFMLHILTRTHMFFTIYFMYAHLQEDRVFICAMKQIHLCIMIALM